VHDPSVFGYEAALAAYRECGDWLAAQIEYLRANRDLESGAGVSTRIFDSQNDSFALHQLGLTMAKQPRQGFGGLVNVTMGKDAQVIHSFPENGPGVTVNNTSMFDLTQAYGQYATGAFTVIAGKFTTLHGTEVIASSGNANISRSMLFGAVPFTHTGVRGTWALSESGRTRTGARRSSSASHSIRSSR